ncbi:MAG: hypothetical protein ACKO8I_13800 [Cyanobacteriota bacterium]
MPSSGPCLLWQQVQAGLACTVHPFGAALAVAAGPAPLSHSRRLSGGPGVGRALLFPSAGGLLGQSGGRFSVHKLHGDARSQGFAIAKDSVHALVDHLEASFPLRLVPWVARIAAGRAPRPLGSWPHPPGTGAAAMAASGKLLH